MSQLVSKETATFLLALVDNITLSAKGLDLEEVVGKIIRARSELQAVLESEQEE